MLHALDRVFRRSPDKGLKALFGALPEELDLPEAIAPGKPVLRRNGESLLVVVAAPHGGAMGFGFSEVPPVTQLPGLARRLEALAQAGAFDGAGFPDTRDPRPADLLAQLMAGTQRVRLKGLLATCGDALLGSGAVSAAAVFALDRHNQRLCALSDESMEPQRDALAHLVASLRGAEPLEQSWQVEDPAEDSLPMALLCERLEAKTLHLSLPPKGEAGYGFAFFDAVGPASDHAQRLRSLLEALRPSPRLRPLRRRALQALALAAIGSFAVWLTLPTERTIATSAVTQPRDVAIISLHFPSFLDHMHLRVGETVARDALVASLRAPEQSDARSDAAFQVAAEEAAAKTAFAEGNYSAYVEAEARVTMQRARLAQIDARLTQLAPTAPSRGRVVQALSEGEAGRYLPAGTEIARIQTSEAYLAELKVTHADARFLEQGQKGQLVLRGLAGVSLPLSVIAPPVPAALEDPGAPPLLTALAAIEASPGDGLLPGLTGFARIDSGPAPRAVVWSRHLTEFLRLRAWTWLNWRL